MAEVSPAADGAGKGGNLLGRHFCPFWFSQSVQIHSLTRLSLSWTGVKAGTAPGGRWTLSEDASG